MICIRPFRALHYNFERVDLAAVIAPPYDVISAEHSDRLHARSPYNSIRLILNREADRYGAAARELAAWRAAGVLAREAAPCLYYYVQNFFLPDGSAWERGGLIGAVRLEPFSGGNIHPHERTLSAPKEDRLRLMRACRANLSPIFMLYPNRIEALVPIRRLVANVAPWIDVMDDVGERHRVWRISDPQLIQTAVNGLADATLFIADGHHRYETALNYLAEQRREGPVDPEAPCNYVLAYMASTDDPGLVILPTHRVFRRLPNLDGGRCLERLAPDFSIEEIPNHPTDGAALRRFLDREAGPGCIGLCLGDRPGPLLLRLREPSLLDHELADVHPAVRRLEVTLLDVFLLEKRLGIRCQTAVQEGALEFVHDDNKAFDAVKSGTAVAAFFLRSPRADEVEAVCLSGQTMPQKSTYFYPKLSSGLLFRLLDEG